MDANDNATPQPTGSVRETWDAAAGSYDNERRNDPVYSECINRTVADLSPRGRVLDAGCGTGLATRQLLSADEVHALDFSPESISVLTQALGHAQHLKAWVGDIRHLPFADNFFDCVLCANTLQHLNRSAQREAVAELLRVLRPGGSFSISVHHFSREKQKAGWKKEGKPGQAGIDYIYRFSRAELRELFPHARIRAVGFYGVPFQGHVSRLLGHLLARVGRGHMLVAHGRKGSDLAG